MQSKLIAAEIEREANKKDLLGYSPIFKKLHKVLTDDMKLKYRQEQVHALATIKHKIKDFDK